MTRISDDGAQMNAQIHGPIGGADIHDARGVLYVDQSTQGAIIEVNTDEHGYAAIEIDGSMLDDVIDVLETVNEERE